VLSVKARVKREANVPMTVFSLKSSAGPLVASKRSFSDISQPGSKWMKTDIIVHSSTSALSSFPASTLAARAAIVSNGPP
jgi:hypothetical protein